MNILKVRVGKCNELTKSISKSTSAQIIWVWSENTFPLQHAVFATMNWPLLACGLTAIHDKVIKKISLNCMHISICFAADEMRNHTKLLGDKAKFSIAVRYTSRIEYISTKYVEVSAVKITFLYPPPLVIVVRRNLQPLLCLHYYTI